MNIRKIKQELIEDLSRLRLNNTMDVIEQQIDIIRSRIAFGTHNESIARLEQLSYLCLDAIDRVKELQKAARQKMMQEMRTGIKKFRGTARSFGKKRKHKSASVVKMNDFIPMTE